MMFEITDAERAKIDEWLYTVVYPPIVKAQEDEADFTAVFITADDKGRKRPYLGAIGGGLTYSFTPTSLGTITKVSHPTAGGGEIELDLTDYDSW